MSEYINFKKLLILPILGLLAKNVNTNETMNNNLLLCPPPQIKFDPFCNTFNNDGSCKICSFRYFKKK
jgi:hypothetical protein